MGVREDFGEDWTRVLAGPLAAGMAVTAADPGGLWGAIKEGMAMGGALRDAQSHAGDSALIDAVVADYQNSEARSGAVDHLKAVTSGKKADEVAKAAVAELGAVGALVAAKAPADAPAYKAWLQAVARKVAEAGTEGGFLGFGGVKVSEAEKAALADIDAALA